RVAWPPLCGTQLSGGRIRTEELHAGQPGMEVSEAIRHHLVADMAGQVDDEAILAERPLRGAGLELGQVDVTRRELPEDAVQAPRVIGPLEADDAGLVVSRGRGDPGRGHQDAPGL